MPIRILYGQDFVDRRGVQIVEHSCLLYLDPEGPKESISPHGADWNLYLPESRAKSTFLLVQQPPESLQQVPIVLMARLKFPLPSVSVWYPSESSQPILALHSGQQGSPLTSKAKLALHFLASLNNMYVLIP